MEDSSDVIEREEGENSDQEELSQVLEHRHSKTASSVNIKKAIEKHDCAANLLKLGWKNCSSAHIKPFDGRLHGALGLRQLRRGGSMDEFSMLRLFMTDEWITKVINESMAPILSNLREPSEKKLPTIEEFWVFIARLLLELVLASPSAHNISLQAALVVMALEAKMKEYRFNGLKSAFRFGNDMFSSCMDHCLSVMVNKVMLGRVVALDETILSTDGQVARQEEMLIFIDGKPHPKGLLIRGLCGKFERSNCVYFLYGRHKHKADTCGVGDACVAILQALERASNIPHIVLIDGAYPCKRILKPTGYVGRSDHICSVTKAAISGVHNHLADACSHFVSLDKHVTLVQEDTGLVATLHNSAGKDIVLISDGISFDGPPPLSNIPKPHFSVSFDQAVAYALLPFESPSELWASFPNAGPYPHLVEDSIPALVKHIWGHDVVSPVDLDGHVTRSVLSNCSLQHLHMIAHALGSPKRSTKERLIDYILKHHPKAAEERVEAQRVAARPMRKRKSDTPSMSCYDVRHMNMDTKQLVEDLLAAGPEPEFHSLYRSAYGLQDRFNAIIYACFRFQNASDPFQMLAYLILATYCINARAMWAEHSNEMDDLSSRPVHTSTFILKVATQIVEKYLQIPIQDAGNIVVTDQNLLALQTEADVAQYVRTSRP